MKSPRDNYWTSDFILVVIASIVVYLVGVMR